MLEHSLVRVYNSKGQVAGSGFLVGNNHILTCAHVISNVANVKHSLALAPNASQPTPQTKALSVRTTTGREIQIAANSPIQDDVFVDFPFLEKTKKYRARVVQFKPPTTSQAATWGGDIAGLELVDLINSQAVPAKLFDKTDLWKQEFRAFGFPSGYASGLWATGKTLGINLEDWIQIESDGNTGIFLEPGFSGAPIWDNDLGGAIGMVVARHKKPESRVAFAISAKKIAELWPEIIRLSQPGYEGKHGYQRLEYKIPTSKLNYNEAEIDTAIASSKETLANAYHTEPEAIEIVRVIYGSLKFVFRMPTQLAIDAVLDPRKFSINHHGEQLEMLAGQFSVEDKTDLRWKNLSKADLRNANLAGADLSYSDLRQVDLRKANLQGADLIKANLDEADLRQANLHKADLSRASLREADLRGAILYGADLSGSKLQRAIVDSDQLIEAVSLRGAIMPNGKIEK
jgi:hypothetical protein